MRRKSLGTTLPVISADASADYQPVNHRYKYACRCERRFDTTRPAFAVHRQFDSGPWLQGGEFRIGDPYGRSDQ